MTFSSGGTERQVYLLSKALAQKGIQVHLVIYIKGGHFWDEVQGPINNLTVYGLYESEPENRLKRYIQLLIKAPFALRKIIQQSRSSAIMSFLYWGNIIGLLSNLFLNSKLYWNIRDANLNLEKKEMVSLYLNRALSFIPKSIISNSHEAVTLHKKIGFSKSKFKVIANGFNTEEFYHDPKAASQFKTNHQLNDKKIILNVGRIHKKKRHDLFLSNLKHLHKVDQRVVGVIAGSGDLGLKNHLQSKFPDTPCLWLDDIKDLRPIYSSANILILSSDSEAFPNVVAEAMLCELPVISSKVGDVPFLLKQIRLYETSDLETLFKISSELIQKSEASLRKEGQNNRQIILQKYAIEAIVDEYIEFLNYK